MSISSSYILGHDSKAKLTRAQTYNLRVYSTTVPHLPDFKFLSCYLYFKLTMFLTYYLSSLCFLTAKQHRKFETNIPRKGIARPQPQFPHSCVCERDLYTVSHDWSAAGKYVDWSWECINRSKTHEWDWGHAIPFLGIHKWDFRCRALVNFS
jgi:hypothetical protein